MSTVAEEAKRLLGDGTALHGMTDPEIRRLVVVEMLDADPACSDAYAMGAFSALVDGDPRVPQARRALRKRRLEILHAAEPAGPLS